MGHYEKKKNGDTPELVEVIRRYEKEFAISDKELTRTNLIVHEIETGEANAERQN